MTMGTILNIEEYINELVDKKIEQALKGIGAGEKKDYYTVPEVAKKFDMNVQHTYRLTREGALGSFKIGRKVLVSQEQLERWLASKRQYTKLERTELAETYVATH